ncbi:L-1,2-propanediol oxidoreductase [Salmonella enterica subsp. arizonae]|uniref:L-1,2-propanediol oxidoreductase n=1 Tax=Salmonella enterica subsp. arizonae TaxID=59203 RepID=A0A379T7E9_SALER|nr:L-1,2-propanediol oxidoreductase [Salmonella enterica subsp. arizonae]
MSLEEARNAAVEAVFTLNRDVGIPLHLRDIGVRKEDIPALAQAAFDDVCTGGNPREASISDIIELYYTAGNFAGWRRGCLIQPTGLTTCKPDKRSAIRQLYCRASRSCCKFPSICKSVCRRAISRQRNAISLCVSSFLRHFSGTSFRWA